MSRDYQEVPVKRKTPGKTVIAHISDLHFESDTETHGNHWEALSNSLTQDIDLLVVTGDLIDSSVTDNLFHRDVPGAFNRAHEFLYRNLSRQADLRDDTCLLVVPGNHDYRIKGNVWKKAQSEQFQDVFRSHFKNCFFPDLNLVVFCIDSNTDDSQINFATGRVEDTAIFTVHRATKELRDQPISNESSESLTRLVLLHHHPMPIGPTERDRSLLGLPERERFNLLENAGTFLQEMVKQKVDMILHGHKHYPSLCKASYRLPGVETPHTVAVVAAGSVGKKGLHPYSYNLLTIFDTGEIELMRRDLTGVTYDSLPMVPLVSYAEARSRKFERLANLAKPKIRARRHSRIEWIADKSGDYKTLSILEEVVPFSENSIQTREHYVGSSSGIAGPFSYKDQTDQQKISWKWKDDRPDEQGGRKAVTTFEPPLRKGHPLSYSLEGTIFNAVHFNQQDRLDTTKGKETDEYLALTASQAYEFQHWQINFPPSRWPKQFQMEATSANNEKDERESTYARDHFFVSQKMQTVSLTIPSPLPGYTYKISWELPPDEDQALGLSGPDKGKAQEIIKRFLESRNGKYNVQACVKELATVISVFGSDQKDDQLETTVFCYDASAKGLVCVAAAGPYNLDSSVWSRLIPPGRFIAGTAYKRREAVLCIQTMGKKEDYYYEQTREPVHTVVFSIPLFYPLSNGRRTAVLTFASRSNIAGLLALEGNEESIGHLIGLVQAWYASKLARALGLKEFLTSGPAKE